MKINPKRAMLLILTILGISYILDFDVFKALLLYALGGGIIILMNVAFFGNIIQMLMKNKDLQDLIKMFKEAKELLKKILENQKHEH